METDALEYAFVRGTEAAAIAAGRLVGLGDKNAVDGAAVEAMRTALAEAPLNGVVVIGEGEKDEAPTWRKAGRSTSPMAGGSSRKTCWGR